MANKPTDTSGITYRCAPQRKPAGDKPSVSTVGMDTEAYPSGKCFMLCTSLGDVFDMRDFPGCLFNRKYRSAVFVAYNLKYDSGALVQHLPISKLKVLWRSDKVEYKGYIYKAIAYKYFSISKDRHAVTFYDMYNFYESTLEKAAATYLGEHKIDLDPKLFTKSYVKANWSKIAAYCVQDAKLVQYLAERLIKQLESYGVKPRKLYSVAYISYQYFRSKCVYITVKRYWKHKREVLDYAMRAYNGGKFEVTEKGLDNYFEYDIISAYPYEISNLIDIRYARVEQTNRYRKTAVYGFLDVTVCIPYNIYSPCAVRRKTVNCYPMGTFQRMVTKAEYEYLIAAGCDITIHNAYWLFIDNKEYPYRREIRRLVKRKQEIKRTGTALDYHIVKLLPNSLYGKFIQLIEKNGKWHASTCWNPIYGAVITANCRISMCELQTRFPQIVAVHTDSVIATSPLPYQQSDRLGELSFETKGSGVILGSGIYQIGDKVRFRGSESRTDLYGLFRHESRTAKIPEERPHTWRQVAHRNLDSALINRFVPQPRRLDVQFDRKRIWLQDWGRFSDVPLRKVTSVPLVYPSIFF